MKSVSTLTLALALTFGTASFVAVPPAHAAKADKAPKGSAPVLSAPFRKAFGDVQTALKAANAADVHAKIGLLEPLSTQPDEKYYLAVMRFEEAKLTKDRALTRKAINDMIGSQSKLINNLPDLYYNAGALAYDAGDYPEAISKMAEADRQGSKDVNRLLLGAEANFKTNQTPSGLLLLTKAINEQTAAGQKPPVDWYRRALSVSLKAKLNSDVTKWSRMLVAAYPDKTNWRDALVLYRDGSRLDPLVQLDIFRLMRQTGSLAGEKDFYDYAEVANARAIPGEAKAVIEEGYASGAASKSSKALSEMYALANGKIAADRASVASDDKRARASRDGVIAANTGNAYLGYGDTTNAIELLRLALSKGGVDSDAVNTRLGIALTKAGQKADARKAFSAVGGTRAEIARYWLLYLDVNP